MKPTSQTPALCGIALTTLLAWGCGSDFAPYNELHQEPRLLALRAAPPSLSPGQSTTLDALAYIPEGEGFTYQWSWCPLPYEDLNGPQCAITEAEFRALAGESVDIPSFDLGSGESVVFAHTIPQELLEDACSSGTEIQSIACRRGGLLAHVQVVATRGDTSITAIKDLHLLYREGAEENQNPEMANEVLAILGEEEIPLSDRSPTVLKTGTKYTLRTTVPSRSIETYTPDPDTVRTNPPPREEQLTITWFVEGGETHVTRTTYIPGENTPESLAQNTWTTPREAGPALLYLILRDDRGGLTWLDREVVLQ